jgi:hypothetical protein
MIPLPELKVDRENYQRPIDEARIKKIIEEFDEVALGTLFVNQRDFDPYMDQLFVFDGQHRLIALRRMAVNGGPNEAPCIVTFGMTLEEEARRYVTMDTERRGLQSMDRFRARIVAQDKDALAVLHIIHESGFNVDMSVGWRNAKAGHIRAVDAVEVCRRRYGEPITLAGLQTLHTVWPESSDAISRNFILGTCRLLFKFGDVIKLRRLDQKLAAVSARQITQRAQGFKENLSSRADDAVGQALYFQYRRGMREETQATMPAWESRVIKPGGPNGMLRLVTLSELPQPTVTTEEQPDGTVEVETIYRPDVTGEPVDDVDARREAAKEAAVEPNETS